MRDVSIRCGGCIYFERISTVHPDLGKCHRYPPLSHTEDDRYPKVSAAGWCGEFVEKYSEEDE